MPDSPELKFILLSTFEASFAMRPRVHRRVVDLI